MRVLDAPVVLAVGFTGGRLDHQLAVLSALLAFRDKPVIVVSEQEVCFHCPPRLVLEMATGERVSIHPLVPVKGVVGEGLRWGIKGLLLEPGGRLGISNEALGGRLEIGFDRPGALVILPVAMLDAVIAALSNPER